MEAAWLCVSSARRGEGRATLPGPAALRVTAALQQASRAGALQTLGSRHWARGWEDKALPSQCCAASLCLSPSERQRVSRRYVCSEGFCCMLSRQLMKLSAIRLSTRMKTERAITVVVGCLHCVYLSCRMSRLERLICERMRPKSSSGGSSHVSRAVASFACRSNCDQSRMADSILCVRERWIRAISDSPLGAVLVALLKAGSGLLRWRLCR
mmetsp:Transcript_13343/g.33961  ORF Transcript_13343/g.33961 Transcript_13343/m.33961 type:complete len:212 (-) Transcript_13343:2057-2692(-)